MEEESQFNYPEFNEHYNNLLKYLQRHSNIKINEDSFPSWHIYEDDVEIFNERNSILGYVYSFHLT